MWLRRALFGAGALAGFGVGAYFVLNSMLSVPTYAGADSDHFRDGRFHNPNPDEPHGFADFLRWKWTSEPKPWREWTDAPNGPPPPPRIDAVVISHNHYDHLDVETLRRLKEAHSPRFFVGLGNGPVLERAGISDAVELDWWQG